MLDLKLCLLVLSSQGQSREICVVLEPGTVLGSGMACTAAIQQVHTGQGWSPQAFRGP